MNKEEELHLKKQEFLAQTLWRCLNRPPELSLEEVAVVIAEEIGDISDFLKKYKKQRKKSN